MKKLMAANWKMFKTRSEASDTACNLVKLCAELPDDREVLICPPFTCLREVDDAFKNHPGFNLGAQNFHPAEQGAFTGEISPLQLIDAGCNFALAGHSERRHIFGEDNDLIHEKLAYGLSKNLNMILCIGETIEERKADQVDEIISTQLEIGIGCLQTEISADNFAVAYEPVWAIGTGEVAGPDEILNAHASVRRNLQKILPKCGSDIRILYGGSVKPDNCSRIISLDNVDGVLVGGASLQADSFSQIVLA